MAFIAWPQALKSDEKHSFFLAPHGAPRCHGTLSILSITHGNHMKGEGLLTLIRILFSKCVFFLTLGYFRNVFVGKNSAEHRTSSGARALTYSEVVQGISAPLDNDFWYRYQKQDFVEATRIALEESLNEGPLVTRFTFIAVHYTFLWRLSKTWRQKLSRPYQFWFQRRKGDSEDSLDKTTSGFNHARGRFLF